MGKRHSNRETEQKKYLLGISDEVCCLDYFNIFLRSVVPQYLIKHMFDGCSFRIGFVLLEMEHLSKSELKADNP